MYQFELRDRTYLLDEDTLLCFSPDRLGELGLRTWEEEGRPADLTGLRQRLLRQYSEAVVDEFVSELDALLPALLADNPASDAVPQRLRSLDLHVAHSCNLACRYCFAGQGDYGQSAALMDERVAFRAIDMLVADAHTDETLSVVFFGGEPLINYPLIRRAVDYIQHQYAAKRFKFSITTNGTLLTDEVADFLAEHDFSVLISMDGIGDVQDSLRPYKDGSGTSADILRSVDRLRKRQSVAARATITSRNLDLLSACSAFGKAGFSRVHFAPVSCADEELRLDAACLAEVREQLGLLSEQALESRRNRQPFIFSGFDTMLSQLKRRTVISHGCAAGRRLLSVTPEGDLFPCHRFVGSAPFQMGTVFTGVDEEARERFWSLTASTREDCRACPIRGLCGGGCIREASRSDGTFGPVVDPLMCELRLETARRSIELLSVFEADLSGGTAGARDEAQRRCPA